MTAPRRHGSAAARGRALERRYRRAAVVSALALVLVTLVVFLRHDPFAHHYEVRAVFSSANGLQAGKEVRIAGVRVGEVSAVDPGPNHSSVVTMRIDEAGRPVHSDATFAIKPRLILEGNFYVAMNPGTPSAPELRAGATVPRRQTSVPVQFDQVLTTFDLATRGALHRSTGELADGLGGAPPATGYGGLRRAVRELDGALVSVTRVAHAARGTQRGDLGDAVRSSAALTSQLAQDPAALAAMVTNANRVMGALAAQDRALAQSIRGFDAVLRRAPPSLKALDPALLETTSFAGRLRPSLRLAPPTLRRLNRLVGQVQGLVRAPELGRLLTRLRPVTAALPSLERRLGGLLPLVTPVNRCASTRVVRTLNEQLPDGPNSTGDPAWLDLLHAFTGTTGVVSGFDGNGVAIRLGVSNGEGSFKGTLPGLGRVVAGDTKIEGVRPTWLGYGVEPPYRPDRSCVEQSLPNLALRSGPPPVWAKGRREGSR